MIGKLKLSYSLSTLLLLGIIVALGVSQIAMMRELGDARAEIDVIRQKFGYLRIGDATDRIHIVRVPNSELPGDTYRLYIPPGHRYLLNLADAKSYTAGDDPQPTHTVSMNTWSDGAEVVLNWTIWLDDDDTPRFRAQTESEELFDERLPNWKSAGMTRAKSVLAADAQRSFDPDDSIYFLKSTDPATGRAVVFWMEPLAKWSARRQQRAAGKAASDATPAATSDDAPAP